jgi:NADPH2:quinone reductase
LPDSGKLGVHLQAILPLAEAPKAHELLESGHTTGKIALTI